MSFDSPTLADLDELRARAGDDADEWAVTGKWLYASILAELRETIAALDAQPRNLDFMLEAHAAHTQALAEIGQLVADLGEPTDPEIAAKVEQDRKDLVAAQALTESHMRQLRHEWC